MGGGGGGGGGGYRKTLELFELVTRTKSHHVDPLQQVQIQEIHFSYLRTITLAIQPKIVPELMLRPRVSPNGFILT